MLNGQRSSINDPLPRSRWGSSALEVKPSDRSHLTQRIFPLSSRLVMCVHGDCVCMWERETEGGRKNDVLYLARSKVTAFGGARAVTCSVSPSLELLSKNFLGYSSFTDKLGVATPPHKRFLCPIWLQLWSSPRGEIVLLVPTSGSPWLPQTKTYPSFVPWSTFLVSQRDLLWSSSIIHHPRHPSSSIINHLSSIRHPSSSFLYPVKCPQSTSP